MVQTPKGIAVNTLAGWIANVTKVGIQLVMLPVMARLLGPAEFGLYALALPTVSLFLVLADGGLGLSLAREDESATEVWSTAFWLLLAVGLAMAVVVTGWGYALAALTGQPRLAGLMAFLSLSFPLITMSVLPSARLTRRGNLVVNAVTDATSALVGSGIAIALAVAGAGAWSLAVQYVSVYVIRALSLNAVASAMPTWTFRFATLTPHLATGSSLLGARVSDFASRIVENIAVSRFFGDAGLGNYTFGNQTSRFLCEAASNPLWAALYAQALHTSAEGIAALYAKMGRILALLIFPASALLAVSAPQVLSIVLGPRWAGAAVLLQIVVPSYAIAGVAVLSSAVLLANQRNIFSFYAVAGNGIGRVLSVCLGHWTGMVGVGIGIALANCLYAVGMLAASVEVTGASVWLLVGGLVPPALAAGVAAVVCRLTLDLAPAGVGSVMAGLALGALAYLIAILILGGPQLRGDLSMIEGLLARRRLARSAGRP